MKIGTYLNQIQAINNVRITLETFVCKGLWLLHGAETFRRQCVISFLDLIVLVATTRRANIHNNNTLFLYEKQFFSNLSIKENCITFS